jgi:hypothetical protein
VIHQPPLGGFRVSGGAIKKIGVHKVRHKVGDFRGARSTE